MSSPLIQQRRQQCRQLRRSVPLIASLSLLAVVVTGCSTTPSTDSSTSSPSATDSTDASYAVTATGQTACYDTDGAEMTCAAEGEALYGQDADFVDGAAMSFTDNSDGTVTDNVTGLLWQQVPTDESFTWDEAAAYVSDLSLGGYDDWRMPTAKELYSIANFSTGWPYLDTSYFTLASGEITKDEQYWTANKYVGVTVEGQGDAAFGVNAVTGHIKAYAASSGGPIGGNFVRAVRGDSYGQNSFVDNGDYTVTDEATALMWAQSDDAVELNWVDALAYANASELGGHTDWRLPNVKELQSIVDYTKSPSATDPDAVGAAIDDVFSSTPITNEAGDSDFGYYWSSTSARFTSGGPYYYAWYVAFGRAVDGEGLDSHGAGAVRFDTKTEDGPDGEGGERYTNMVRLVRDAA